MSAQSDNAKVRLGDVEMHEFYLNYTEVGKPIIRIALGSLIDCTQRKTFTPKGPNNEELETCNLTGDIGFMDVVLRQENVPQPGITAYSLKNFWVTDALTVLSLAIEPEYQIMKRGYGSVLMQKAEEIAREDGRDYVVIDNIVNPLLAQMAGRRGYLLSRSEHRAVKDLNSSFSWLPDHLRMRVMATRV
ncbi:MAG: GNAT family N-acetyltransferase [Nanoarchaeota archaeon]|nr:GNAT family N-acetyltransferase [Nanoarchaeota archaeon]